MPNFNLNPNPRSGQGAYGLVPGSLDIPPNIYEQVAGVTPNLGQGTQAAFGNIQSELAGRLSAGTRSNLQDAAAAWGVGTGMPWETGDGLPMSRYLQSIGLTSEGLANKGIQDYLSFLTGVGSTQTNPALASEIQTQNAVWNAAPDPTAANLQQQSLYDRYLQYAQGGNRPSGGTGTFSMSPIVNDPYNIRGAASSYVAPSAAQIRGGGYSVYSNNMPANVDYLGFV